MTRGLPTVPESFEVDERGQLVVGADGAFVLAKVKRRELRLPNFHSLRHGAAMDCDDAEEARDLLRHKNGASFELGVKFIAAARS